MQSATWPCNLKRFRPFKRLRDGDSIIYRPVCWDPHADTLHVLKIAGRHTPRGAGCWEQWKRSAANHPLDDIYLVDESLIPLQLTEQLEKLPSSCVVGFERRMSLLRAFAFVDPAGNGNPQDFLFNDFIFISESTRIESAKRVCTELGQPRGYQTYLRELLHKYAYNGGHWKGDDRGPLRINVKRLDSSPHTLMWLRHDGSVAELRLVEEDERTLGPCQTWKQWDLMWMDDLLQGKKLARKSVQTGMRLTIGEHRNIGEVARRRAEVNPGLLFGASVRGARLNAEAKRNASRAAEQAKAYGLVDTEMTAEGRARGDDAAVTCYPSQQSFYRTLTARLKDVL